MAEGQASSGLSIDDMHALLKNAPPADRAFLKELLEQGTPREAMVFAQLLHYFPDAHFDDKSR